MERDGDVSLDLLLKAKESEVKEIQNMRAKKFETQIKEKEGQYHILSEKYQELMEGYEYNLNVIAERDSDLEDLKESIYNLKGLLDQSQEREKELEATIEKNKNDFEERFETMKVSLATIKEKLKDTKRENQYLKQGQSEEITQSKAEFQKQTAALQNIIQNLEKSLSVKDEQSNQAIRSIVEENRTEKENLNRILKKLREDKERSLEDLGKSSDSLKTENLKLRDELSKVSKVILEKEKQSADQITELKILNSSLNAKNEDMFRELQNLKANTNFWNQTVEEKLESAQVEKEELMAKWGSKKLKYTNKIKHFEEEVRDLTITREKLLMSEDILKTKLHEAEQKLKKEKFASEETIHQKERNKEQDIRKLKSELDMKDYQLSNIENERDNLQKKFLEQCEELKKVEEKLETADKENKILIQKVAQQRIVQNKSGSPQREAVQKKSGQKFFNPKHVQSPSAHVDFRPDIDEAQSIYEPEFSEDLGPVSIFPSHTNLNFSPKKSKISPVKISNDQLRILRDDNEFLREQNEELKQTVREMSDEMQSVRHIVKVNEYQLSQASDEKKKLEEKVTDLMEDVLKAKEKYIDMQSEYNNLDVKYKRVLFESNVLNEEHLKFKHAIQNYSIGDQAREKELADLRSRVQQQANDNKKLKSERDKLIEISSELRSKINRFEDEVESLKERLSKLKKGELREGFPQEVAEKRLPSPNSGDIKIRREPSNNPVVPPLQLREFVPERDVRSADVNKNKSGKPKLEDLVRATTKPLVENKTENIPNSLKATESQKKVENSLKNNTRKTSPQVRNYNVINDE